MTTTTSTTSKARRRRWPRLLAAALLAVLLGGAAPCCAQSIAPTTGTTPAAEDTDGAAADPGAGGPETALDHFEGPWSGRSTTPLQPAAGGQPITPGQCAELCQAAHSMPCRSFVMAYGNSSQPRVAAAACFLSSNNRRRNAAGRLDFDATRDYYELRGPLAHISIALCDPNRFCSWIGDNGHCGWMPIETTSGSGASAVHTAILQTRSEASAECSARLESAWLEPMRPFDTCHLSVTFSVTATTMSNPSCRNQFSVLSLSVLNSTDGASPLPWNLVNPDDVNAKCVAQIPGFEIDDPYKLVITAALLGDRVTVSIDNITVSDLCQAEELVIECPEDVDAHADPRSDLAEVHLREPEAMPVHPTFDEVSCTSHPAGVLNLSPGTYNVTWSCSTVDTPLPSTASCSYELVVFSDRPPPPPPNVDCLLSSWELIGKCSARCGGGTMVEKRYVLRERSGEGEPCGETTRYVSCNVHSCTGPPPLPHQCPQGFFYSPETDDCVQCDMQCAPDSTCTKPDAKSCLKCRYVRSYEGVCSEDCPKGTHVVNGATTSKVCYPDLIAPTNVTIEQINRTNSVIVSWDHYVGPTAIGFTIKYGTYTGFMAPSHFNTSVNVKSPHIRNGRISYQIDNLRETANYFLFSVAGYEYVHTEGPYSDPIQFRLTIDCQMQWTAWSPCTSTCYKGSQFRQQQVRVPPRNGGAPCPPASTETRSCGNQQELCNTPGPVTACNPVEYSKPHPGVTTCTQVNECHHRHGYAIENIQGACWCSGDLTCDPTNPLDTTKCFLLNTGTGTAPIFFVEEGYTEHSNKTFPVCTTCKCSPGRTPPHTPPPSLPPSPSSSQQQAGVNHMKAVAIACGVLGGMLLMLVLLFLAFKVALWQRSRPLYSFNYDAELKSFSDDAFRYEPSSSHVVSLHRTGGTSDDDDDDMGGGRAGHGSSNMRLAAGPQAPGAGPVGPSNDDDGDDDDGRNYSEDAPLLDVAQPRADAFQLQPPPRQRLIMFGSMLAPLPSEWTVQQQQLRERARAEQQQQQQEQEQEQQQQHGEEDGAGEEQHEGGEEGAGPASQPNASSSSSSPSASSLPSQPDEESTA